MNIGFISLGCAKNQVDTEIMMGILKKSNNKIVNKLENAEIVIINTCGFITEAKEEAINNIIKTGKLKKQGNLKYIIAAGCLSQRYGKELLNEMPELDGVVGISSFIDIDKVVKSIIEGNNNFFIEDPPINYIEEGPRHLTTPPGWAYLKISEGCNNKCSYCAIPLIRGNLRSRSYNNILSEANELVNKNGIHELIIIAQDTTMYGSDLNTDNNLVFLLNNLCTIDNLSWIRLMYMHPASINKDLVELINKQIKIIPYLDIPIQHYSEKILNSMNRKHNSKYLKNTIDDIKKSIDDVVLRTTVMVGFPGETEDDFKQLCDFIQDTEFDWLGVFGYQGEDGTVACSLPNQIPDEIKEERKDIILRLQSKITRNKNIKRLEKTEKILITSKIDKNLYIGRGYFQAPEVDGITIVKSNETLEIGEFYKVKLKGIRNYDMIGEKNK